MITKGAVDVLIERIKYIRKNNQIVPITAQDREDILAMNMEFSQNGLRVLAITYKKLTAEKSLDYDDENDWLYSSFWYKNFDEMAKKTMLRQLLSKHGLLSTEMQKAVESDQAVITKDLQPEYVDNENVIDNAAVEKEQTQSIEENSAPTVEEVMNQVNQAQPEPVLEDIDPMQM